MLVGTHRVTHANHPDLQPYVWSLHTDVSVLLFSFFRQWSKNVILFPLPPLFPVQPPSMTSLSGLWCLKTKPIHFSAGYKWSRSMRFSLQSFAALPQLSPHCLFSSSLSSPFSSKTTFLHFQFSWYLPFFSVHNWFCLHDAYTIIIWRAKLIRRVYMPNSREVFSK